jgi:pseudouridine 5'-phosphatase
MSKTAPSGLPAIRACLFDMDGLIIDSEDLYTLCANEILREYGKPDLPWSIKAQLQGRPAPEATKIFQAWAQLPIPFEEFNRKTQALHAKHFPNSKPLPGVEDLLAKLQRSSAKVSLATSTHKLNFRLKTAHLPELFAVFKEENRVLGDDERIQPGRGKPAPDIYLLALDTLNQSLHGEAEIHPEECLVFEDSVPGVEAGRRAGMQVVWCPHQGLLGEYSQREKEVLAGLTGQHEDDGGADEEWARKQEAWIRDGRVNARVRGRPGEFDDGWARLYSSLEDFPLDYYGIGIS